MSERKFIVTATNGVCKTYGERSLRDTIAENGLKECVSISEVNAQMKSQFIYPELAAHCECGEKLWRLNPGTGRYFCAACMRELPRTKDVETSARVTRISFGRTYDLGNYENERLDVSVDVPEGESAAEVLKQLEQLFAEVDPKNEKEDFKVRDARIFLETPLRIFSADEATIKKIAEAKQTVAEHQKRKDRMKTACNLLDHLGAQSEYKDGKWQWDESDDGRGIPF